MKALTNEERPTVRASRALVLDRIPKVEIETPADGRIRPAFAGEIVHTNIERRLSNESQNTMVPEGNEHDKYTFCQDKMGRMGFESARHPIPYHPGYTHSEPDNNRGLWPIRVTVPEGENTYH